MNDLVIIDHGKSVTSSMKVAEVFGKEHRNVVRAIKSLQVPDEWCALNFERTSIDILQPNGGIRKEKAYNISKDGFYFLCMGFTGIKATQFKLAFIEAFNRMEETLRAQIYLPPREESKNEETMLTTAEVAEELDVSQMTVRRHFRVMKTNYILGKDYKWNPLRFTLNTADAIKRDIYKPLLTYPSKGEEGVTYPKEVAEMLGITLAKCYELYKDIKDTMISGRHYLFSPVRFLPGGVERMLEAGRNRAQRTRKKKLTVPKDWGGRELIFSLGDMEITIKRN